MSSYFTPPCRLGGIKKSSFSNRLIRQHVQVRFTLYADGRVDKVKAVQTNASEIATFICETAITKRSPFRPWTKEMVHVFGQNGR